MTDTKMSSDSENLAQEALDSTEQTSPAEKSAEETVPLHKHTALRTRAQAAEVAQARAEGELAGIRQAQAPAAKSPLDAEIERQAAEGIAEEDMTFTPALYRKQQSHDQQIAKQAATEEAARKLAIKQVASKNKAMADHEDWPEVIAAGEIHLTPGELVDIQNAGADFGEVVYSKCQTAAARHKPKTDTAPEKKPDESEAEKKEAEKIAADEKVPTQEEILAAVGGEPDAVRASQL